MRRVGSDFKEGSAANQVEIRADMARNDQPSALRGSADAEHVGFGKGLNFRSVALEPNYLAGLGYSLCRETPVGFLTCDPE